MFSSLRKLFKSEPDPREARRPLWNAIVATARQPHWYSEGGVPDTLDGRFDMISLILALVLHRIDEDPDKARAGVELLREQGYRWNWGGGGAWEGRCAPVRPRVLANPGRPRPSALGRFLRGR